MSRPLVVDPIYKALGKALRKRRVAQGMTIVEASKRFETTPGRISEFERAVTRPWLHVVHAYCAILRCSLQDVVADALAELERVEKLERRRDAF